LQQATDLAKPYNGPYTLCAPSDNAFKKMPDEDRQSLWANKKKLKQVLQVTAIHHVHRGKHQPKSPPVQ
jgi:uncharacterized surface protein with fasciclin (FAS1) repeats